MSFKFCNYRPQGDASNLKYKRKVRRMRAHIKNVVFENAALCDQVAQIQENILCVKEERRFLLKKLIEFDNDIEYPNSFSSGSGVSNDFVIAPPRKQIKKRSLSDTTAKTKVQANGKIKVSKKSLIQSVPLDQNGHPAYPLELNHFTVYNLGTILTNTGFHSTHWIYPVGYTVTRVFAHMKYPEKKCTYTCKILENGDSPRFEIIPENDSEFMIAGNTADYCHAALLQCINKATDIRSIDIRPQGEWFFGLAHPTIMTLLQNMPNVKNCVNFKGFEKEPLGQSKDNDPTISYEALQRNIAISVYHTVPEIKEEPPDELIQF